MKHPYTEALLSSIPRLNDPKHTRLTPIEGFPPDIVDGPEGCKFAARCKYAQDICLTSTPEETTIDSHTYFCHFPVGTDAGSEAFLSEIVGAESWPGQRHPSMESIYEYGSRVGVWRLLKLFKQKQLPLTVFAVGMALERNPAVADMALEHGHEICSHG